MRELSALVLSAVSVGALAWFFVSRKPEPSGRGDEYPPQDAENYGFFVDGGEYGPPLWFGEEIMTDIPSDPVYDPRDVMSRRYLPSQLFPSEQLRDMLKRRETLSLKRYELGDGGVTIGYGHYEPYSRAHLIPETITVEVAESMFEEDVEARGARWVREYVSVPLTQHEFDAMVHIAFNLSPRSFKRIADALNLGEDWRAVALSFVRPDAPHLTRGLINRRNEEIALFDSGSYA